MADPLERLTNLTALLLRAGTPLTLDQIATEMAGQYPDDLATAGPVSSGTSASSARPGS